MTSKIAECSCGQLKVACEGEPVRVAICCCGACQKRTGSAYGVGAFFLAAQITSITGTAKTFTRTSEAGRPLHFHFCPECGSTIYWEAEFRPGLVGVAIGAFTDAADLVPAVAVWTKHMPSWVPMPIGIPTYSAQT